MDDPSHSVFLYLSTDTLSQNEVDILLKWGEVELKKTQNLEKKTCTESFCELIHDFSVLEHPWPLEMKFLPFTELILGLSEILQP